jgi:hypothetical protein
MFPFPDGYQIKNTREDTSRPRVMCPLPGCYTQVADLGARKHLIRCHGIKMRDHMVSDRLICRACVSKQGLLRLL